MAEPGEPIDLMQRRDPPPWQHKVRHSDQPMRYLALDFGVDYGDVLAWSWEYRRMVREEPAAPGRVREAGRAMERMCLTIGHRRVEALLRLIMAHAIGRWGG